MISPDDCRSKKDFIRRFMGRTLGPHRRTGQRRIIVRKRRCSFVRVPRAADHLHGPEPQTGARRPGCAFPHAGSRCRSAKPAKAPPPSALWPLPTGADKQESIVDMGKEQAQIRLGFPVAVADEDQAAFDEVFRKVGEFFGPFTEEALDQSGFLIDRLVELSAGRSTT